MRTIIEKGRELSPCLNKELDSACSMATECMRRMSDLYAINNDASKTAMAMAELCIKGLTELQDTLVAVISEWRKFDSTLGQYKYKFRDGASARARKDLPGQQVLFDESNAVNEVLGH